MYVYNQILNINILIMHNIGINIRRIRENKGYSQDYMANMLNISQASYARLENEDTKITIDRLYEIAKILETNILDFLNEGKIIIQTQTNNEGAYGNGYIQNLHIEHKTMYDKLIASLRDEISFLRTQLNKK